MAPRLFANGIRGPEIFRRVLCCRTLENGTPASKFWCVETHPTLMVRGEVVDGSVYSMACTRFVPSPLYF